MAIYMGPRIAGKQDRSSLIIEHPIRAPKIPLIYAILYNILAINSKSLLANSLTMSYICHRSTVMRLALADILIAHSGRTLLFYGANRTSKMAAGGLFEK